MAPGNTPQHPGHPMNTSRVNHFCLFVVLYLSVTLPGSPVWAIVHDASTPSGAVVLDDGTGTYPLGRHLEILEDPTARLTLDEVMSPAFADRFTPSLVDVPGFGFSQSAYWAKVTLDRRTNREQGWMLEFAYAPMQWIDVYTYASNLTRH